LLLLSESQGEEGTPDQHPVRAVGEARDHREEIAVVVLRVRLGVLVHFALDFKGAPRGGGARIELPMPIAAFSSPRDRRQSTVLRFAVEKLSALDGLSTFLTASL
jgi:hypothetical protein